MEELKSFVTQSRAAGQTDEQIKQSLLAAGWKPEQFSPVFALGASQASSTADTSLDKTVVPSMPSQQSSAAQGTKDSDESLNGYERKFDWGAFWLTWIWGVSHGKWWTLILFFLTSASIGIYALTSLGSIVGNFFGTDSGQGMSNASLILFLSMVAANLLVSIFFGFFGGKWALADRKDRSVEQVLKRKSAWSVAGWIVGAIIILSWLSFGYNYYVTKNLTGSVECAPGVSLTDGSGAELCENSDSLSMSQYLGTGFSFEYPKVWEQKKMSELLQIPTSESDPTLFFTNENYQTVQETIAKVKNNTDANAADGLGLILGLPEFAEVVVTKLVGVPAQGLAQSATQTVCIGDSQDFSTDNSVDTTRITELSVGSNKAYSVASEERCNKKTITLFIEMGADSTLTLTFNGTQNITALNTSQKKLLDSLKFE